MLPSDPRVTHGVIVTGVTKIRRSGSARPQGLRLSA